MLTKDDCMSILISLEDKGIDINSQMKNLIISPNPPISVLKFIIENKGVSVVEFYEMLRKKHNQKKSSLYKNILDETADIFQAVTMLSCLLTQIILFGQKLDTGATMFFAEVRAEEIASVLTEYFKSGDFERGLKLLKLIKSDLLVLEYLNGRRETQ